MHRAALLVQFAAVLVQFVPEPGFISTWRAIEPVQSGGTCMWVERTGGREWLSVTGTQRLARKLAVTGSRSLELEPEPAKSDDPSPLQPLGCCVSAAEQPGGGCVVSLVGGLGAVTSQLIPLRRLRRPDGSYSCQWSSPEVQHELASGNKNHATICAIRGSSCLSAQVSAGPRVIHYLQASSCQWLGEVGSELTHDHDGGDRRRHGDSRVAGDSEKCENQWPRQRRAAVVPAGPGSRQTLNFTGRPRGRKKMICESLSRLGPG
eukprot:2046558-Rhodomonas_salina.1